jgi:multisubunit Na+/H+ antiporter MnhF subunit
MSVVFDVVMVILLVSLLLVVLRLMRGPTLPDRAVAGDRVSMHVVALIVIYSMSSHQPTLIDLVIVTAIVGFVSMAVVGIYIERSARGKTRAESGD